FPEAPHFAAQRSRLQHKTSQTIVWLTRWGLGEADTDLPRGVDWIIWCTRFCDRADETTLRRSFGGRHSHERVNESEKYRSVRRANFRIRAHLLQTPELYSRIALVCRAHADRDGSGRTRGQLARAQPVLRLRRPARTSSNAGAGPARQLGIRGLRV